MKKGTLRNIAIGVMSLALIGVVNGCSLLTSTTASDTITVVGKNFTEQDIMAYMVGDLIAANTKHKVKVTSYLGGTDVCFQAMKSGHADVYVEYTGTGLVNLLNEKVMSDPQQVYDKVKSEFPGKFHMEWEKPIGFNNTYAIAVTEATAKKYNLHTISDLKAHAGELTFGTEQEFLGRPDGLPGLEKAYGLHFKADKAMDPGLKYQALSQGQVDLIDSFSTDGRLVKNHLVLLQDDKHFFPPYYAAPLVTDAALKQYPDLAGVLNKLAGKIDDKTMSELNAQVDVDKKKAKDVADAWLKQQGLM